MENRRTEIRRLQSLITNEEAQKAILEKHGLYSPARQALLDGLKSRMEYEKQMELKEIRRPVTIQSAKRSWQDNIILYIVVSIAIAVITYLIVTHI